MLTAPDRPPVHRGLVVCSAGLTLALGVLAGLRTPATSRPQEPAIAPAQAARPAETSHSFPDPGSATPAEMRRNLETCDSLDRTRRLLGWLDRSETSTFPALYEELGRSFITSARTESTELLVAVWMSRDPTGCLAFMDTPRASLGNRGSYENSDERALGNWSMRSPQDAAAWLAARIEKDPGDWFHPGALRGLIATDLPATLAFLNSHPQIRSDIYLGATKLMPLGFDGCVSWIGALKNDELRREMEASAADKLLKLDDPRAAAWAASLPDPASRDAMTALIASKWLGEDFDTASAWVATLPVDLQKSTLKSMAADFSSLGKNTAAWLLSHDDPATDELRLACIGQAGWEAKTDWEAKADLAQGISDPARRTAGLAELVTHWLDEDCYEAQKWTRAHPGAVPPEIEARVDQAVAELEKDIGPREEDESPPSSGEDRPGDDSSENGE